MSSDQVISELTKKVEFLLHRQVQMEKENRVLHKRFDRLEPLTEENKYLHQENSVLKTENSDLKAEVAKLKAQLNSNSRNSSKPPSSDGYKRKPALTTLLNVDYRIPFKKIPLLFGDLFGYAINASTVYANSRQCSERLAKTKTIEIIKSRIIEAITAHTDETRIRVEEMLRWLHVATTEFYTYLFVHEKRGRLALESEQSTKTIKAFSHVCRLAV